MAISFVRRSDDGNDLFGQTVPPCLGLRRGERCGRRDGDEWILAYRGRQVVIYLPDALLHRGSRRGSVPGDPLPESMDELVECQAELCPLRHNGVGVLRLGHRELASELGKFDVKTPARADVEFGGTGTQLVGATGGFLDQHRLGHPLIGSERSVFDLLRCGDETAEFVDLFILGLSAELLHLGVEPMVAENQRSCRRNGQVVVPILPRQLIELWVHGNSIVLSPSG